MTLIQIYHLHPRSKSSWFQFRYSAAFYIRNNVRDLRFPRKCDPPRVISFVAWQFRQRRARRSCLSPKWPHRAREGERHGNERDTCARHARLSRGRLSSYQFEYSRRYTGVEHALVRSLARAREGWREGGRTRTIEATEVRGGWGDEL